MKTLNEWLNYLEHSSGVSSKELSSVLKVAKRLEIDTTEAKVITVTGTNGKGSCVEMLTSAYVEAGYSVGTYTSPHLFSFNERIRIQRKPVNDSLICEAFQRIEQAKKADTHLTYFAWVTLAALLIFKEQNTQVIILEVGIGGRLDATNIIDADLAIISSIGLDHMEYLGHTREDIAREKMGICRKDQWAICGDPEPPEILRKMTKKLGTKMRYLGEDFCYEMNRHTWSFFSACCFFSMQSLILPVLSVNNAAIVIQAVLLLNKVLPVNLEEAISSIIATELRGRCEEKKMKNGATLVLDVAHNPQAAAHLAKFLQTYADKNIIALFSMLKDKDIQGTIAEMKTLVKEWHVVEINYSRRASKEQLEEAFRLQHLSAHFHESWDVALATIKSTLTKKDVLVIFGSFFVISAVSPFL